LYQTKKLNGSYGASKKIRRTVAFWVADDKSHYVRKLKFIKINVIMLVLRCIVALDKNEMKYSKVYKRF
jgi:hypothetical protein